VIFFRKILTRRSSLQQIPFRTRQNMQTTKSIGRGEKIEPKNQAQKNGVPRKLFVGFLSICGDVTIKAAREPSKLAQILLSVQKGLFGCWRI
jgi:hypothetical protein